MKRLLLLIPFFLMLLSCGTNTDKETIKDSVVNNYKDVPEQREVVNENAVKDYEEIVQSDEITDHFKVSLFETKNTFRYVIKIRYKNLAEQDTLRIPNLNIQPLVDIKKGDTRPSCIIGFYDKQNQFCESKLIYFKDDKLKVKVLKYYSVTVTEDTAR